MYSILKKSSKYLLGEIYYYLIKKYHEQGNRALIYHAFGSKLKHDTYGISIDIKKFSQHMEYITDNYETTHINNADCSEINISITIDDGYKDTINAVDVLTKKNIPFTLYISPGNLDKTDYLSSKDVKDISLLNECIIGTHGYSHRKLSTLDKIQQKAELQKSKIVLGDLIGKDVNTLSYPHGSFNQQTISIAKELGYVSAASSIKGFNNIKTHPFKMRRVEVIASDKSKELSKKIKGYYDFY